MMKELSEKNIERLSLYRQTLAKYCYTFSPHINSADLARILNLSEENVRRDLMLIGCKSTNTRKGFSVIDLINRISEVLDYQSDTPVNIVIIGNDNCLREALLDNYISQKIHISGIFNFCYQKTENVEDITYYPLDKLNKIVVEEKAVLAVINISAEYAEQISEILINSGIKGIINFSPVKLNVPPHIYVEQINQVTILEKAIFNIKKNDASLA